MDARKRIAAAMDTTIAATAVVKPVFHICMAPAPDLPVKRRPFRDAGGRTPCLAFPEPLCGLPDVPLDPPKANNAAQTAFSVCTASKRLAFPSLPFFHP